jgi:hypothetical protein
MSCFMSTRLRRQLLPHLLMVAGILAAGGITALRAQNATGVEPTPAAASATLRIFRPNELIPYPWRMLARKPYVGPLNSISPETSRELQEWAQSYGGTAVLLRPAGDAHEAVVVSYTGPADSLSVTAASPPSTESPASSGASGCTGSCPVHVRGYTRRDGTYVRPHTRSAPGTRSGGRRP